mmetsp:Transcript_12326/g.47921  ORF Transcript_12326/g.47921 Transcript_12326/m.47921 type:complete len:251 (+) Transcript_12326:2211-2963(+)
MMSMRASRLGRGISITRSKRPGRISAGSMTCGLFVAANTITPLLPPKPSISVRSWLMVATCSSLPSIAAASFLRTATESNSSMKMMHGRHLRAWLNRLRIRAAPTPTNISMKSEPDMDRNGTPDSPAVALARSVLPVPGGPTSSAPRGIFAPRSSYFLGFLRKSTNSMISPLASSQPATSLNMILCLAFLSRVVTEALPTLKMPPPGPPPPGPPMPGMPPILRFRNTNPASRRRVGASRASSVPHATSLR